MGGEKRRLSECAQWAEGSPPHGRGKVDDPEGGDLIHRITPAWAGKSAEQLRAAYEMGDHPRMGGEKSCCLAGQSVQTGSPPHGRGKAVQSA